MNKAKKNVVVVGFNQIEKNSLSLPLIENNIVHYVDSLKDATKYQGYLLIIDNTVNIKMIDLDKKYRKTFNKYELIWLYNESYDCFFDKWSRIEKIGRDIFADCSSAQGDQWDEYKREKEQTNITSKINKDKKEKLDILYNYLKKYKAIKTKQIGIDLKIDKRTIQRYMNDLNTIYHNIGYDYSRNEWYFIW